MIVIFRRTEMQAKMCPTCQKVFMKQERLTSAILYECELRHWWVAYDPKWGVVVDRLWQAVMQYLAP